MIYKNWSGDLILEGSWEISIKIDGVFAHINNSIALSKAEKPLYNLSHLQNGRYEIYKNNWNDSISAVRTMQGTPVDLMHVYSLDPLDERLFIGDFVNPSTKLIQDLLDKQVAQGFEGLILRQDDLCFKVKKFYTVDIPIIGVCPGDGRNQGKLGAFLTRKGRVGTGLSDKQREEYKALKAGTVIEVQYFELTKNNKFRHPKFIRVRWDK